MDSRPGGEDLTSPAVADQPTRRSLRHDTLWSVVATGTRTVGAIIMFLMLARFLGEEQYGLYAAALALFLLIGAFVTLGTSHIVVQRISRNAETAQSAWGAALLPGLVLSVTVAGLLAVLADISVPGLDGKVIFILGLAEFTGASISVLAAFALQALDRYPASAAITMLWTVLRLAFLAVVFFALDQPTLEAVGWAFLTASIIAGVIGSVALASMIGPPRFSVAESVQLCREGSPFSLTQASGIVLGDIDKQMLIRLDATPEFSTGIYSAGNRVLGLTAAPVYAVLAATYPRFFARGGTDGLRGTWAYSRKLVGPVALYAALSGTGLYLVAPLIDDVLGAGYADSIGVIRWMALVPIIHLPGLIAGEALTGAGYQGMRNRFILGAGSVNVVLNLALIGRYGVTGAIIATYAAELFLFVGLIGWIRRMVRS